MAYQTLGFAVIGIVFFLIKYLNRTDVPKIKNLPEIPGVPIFGNLLQFGSAHARVAGGLAKKYGPVFQVRFGNRVGALSANDEVPTDMRVAYSLCQHFRLSQASLDHQPVLIDLPAYPTYLPHCGLELGRLHHRYLAVG
jgi:hypothetical protein